MKTLPGTDKARFQKLMGNANAWMPIEKLVSLCDEGRFWTENFLAGAVDSAKKTAVRRLIKTLKDRDGWPIWANVETTNEEGKTERLYKQELLFDPNDYRQVFEYHNERSTYHRKMAQGYASRCKKRFHVQLKLPFDETSDPKKPR